MARYSSVIAALIERIEAHKAAEGILDGFKFEETPINEISGQKDLPCIRMFVPSFVEKVRPPMAIVDGQMIVRIAVSTERKDGLADHLEAVENVCDALELDGEAFDPQLGNLLSEQMQISSAVPDGQLTDLSISSELTIALKPRTCAGASRRPA